MKLFNVIFIPYLLGTFFCSVIEHEVYENISFSNIIDVMRFYGISNPIFLQNEGNNNNLVQWYFQRDVILRLIRQGISVKIFPYTHLLHQMSSIKLVAHKTLFLIYLTNQNDVEEYQSVTHILNHYNYQSYLVFSTTIETFWYDYCLKPKENFFKLRFNTKLIAQCAGESILKEWYSIDDTKVETIEIGNFDADKGLILRVRNSTDIYDRRKSIGLRPLRGVVVTDSAVVQVLGKNKYGGYVIRLLNELFQIINGTLIIVNETKSFGTYNAKRKTWSGAISELMTNRADIGIALFVMYSERMDVIEFSKPLARSTRYLYFRQVGSSDVKWMSYFHVFETKVWYTLLFIVAVIPFILTAVEVKIRSMKLSRLVTERYFSVWGIFCQQSMDDFPERASLRFAYFSIFLASIAVMAYYSAFLMSYIAIPIGGTPFDTIQEFLQDESYKLIVRKSNADFDNIVKSDDRLFQHLATKLKDEESLPTTISEAYQQICMDKIGLYSSNLVMVGQDVPCKITRIGAVGGLHSAFIMRKNLSYMDIINYRLQNFRELGIISHLKHSLKMNDLPEPFDPPTINKVAPILVILLFTAILSILIMIAERIIYQKVNF